jgi:nucleoid-associated protein YgaU
MQMAQENKEKNELANARKHASADDEAAKAAGKKAEADSKRQMKEAKAAEKAAEKAAKKAEKEAAKKAGRSRCEVTCCHMHVCLDLTASFDSTELLTCVHIYASNLFLQCMLILQGRPQQEEG